MVPQMPPQMFLKCVTDRGTNGSTNGQTDGPNDRHTLLWECENRILKININKRDFIFYIFRQYIITKHKDTNTFPIQSRENIALTKRAKGIQRSFQAKCLSFYDFYDCVKNNNESRKVEIASLKRSSFRIYLIRTKKKLLSRYNSKRYFSDKYKTKKSYFSFPLNFRVQRLVE